MSTSNRRIVIECNIPSMGPVEEFLDVVIRGLKAQPYVHEIEWDGSGRATAVYDGWGFTLRLETYEEDDPR